MVATVTALGAAQSTVHYFERDGYYARDDPEHRRASFWHGRGAAALGLRGHVRPKRFEAVLAGHVPHTGIRLGRKRDGEHQHRPGLDVTLSAPKSVSLEALVFGERRVVRAHDAAVRETLDWVEAELLQTRGYDPATGRRPRVRANAMVAAGFRHLTSRDQDPQLHTHCVIANMTRNDAGAWRSLEWTRLRRSERLIGAFYRNALALRLHALGYAIAPTLIGRVPGFEIAGYGRPLLDAFSGRRRALLAWLAERGLPYTPALAQAAALATRRRKADLGLGVLIPRWRERARALGLTRSGREARPPRPLDPETGRRAPRGRVPAPELPANVVRNRRRCPALPALAPDADLEGPRASQAQPTAPAELLRAPERGVLEAVGRAVAALDERRALLPEAEVRALALGSAPGRHTLAEVDAAIARLVGDGALVEVPHPGGHERAFVTEAAIRAERGLLAAMRRARERGGTLTRAPVPEALPDGAALTRGQREAVEAIARAPDRLIGVQGHAGAGKTAMLRAAAGLAGMPRLHGLAPSAAAVRALGEGAGIAARTLQSFLARFEALEEGPALARARDTYAGTVLVLDEASMVGTAQMAALLRIGERLGVARVVLLGDTRQLRAVDAGQPFRVLQGAGMATAVMDEVLRQRDPTLRAAVAAVRDGHPGAALRALGERVHETDRERLGEAAAAVWLALPDDAREQTLVLAPTHALRRAIHATVREGLAREGVLHGPVLHIERLVDRRLTRAETAELRSYAVGDTVAFHRDAYGCRSGDHCQVAALEEDAVVLAHPDGAPRRFRPAGNVTRYLRVFDAVPLELRAGDAVRWTRNRPARTSAPALLNGDTARVLAIGAKRVRFATEHGARFSLARADPQLRHLDHAWSATVHAAQGRTAHSVIAVLDSESLNERTLLYVQMSRAAEDFVLLTDDREALADTLARREGARDGALEAIGESLTDPPPVAPEVFERLRDDWRALRERADAAGDLPCFDAGYEGLVARAGALAAVEDLPLDMRRFTAMLLADHARHRARRASVARLVTRLQAQWRRWPELDWAERDAPDSELAIRTRDPEPPTHAESPARAAWRAEAGALLGDARALLEHRAEGSLHLEVDPTARAGLEAAAGVLERVCVREDFRRFERRWARLRDAEGPSHLHTPGYAALAALGERLRRAGTLDPEHRRVLDAWHTRHEAEIARGERRMRYPDEAGTLTALWRRDGASAAEPWQRWWRDEATALLAEGRAMLEPGSAHAAELDAAPEQAAALRDAVESVAGAVRDQARGAFERLAREVEESAREAGTLAFDTPGYDALAEWARALEDLDQVPEPVRRRLAAWRKDHDACRRRREALERYAERVEALGTRPRPGDPEWRREALALVETGRDMLSDSPAWRAHLEAVPAARNPVAAALASVCGRLAREGVLDAAEAAHAVPCRARVLVGDRIAATVRGPWVTGAERGSKRTIEGEVASVLPLGAPGEDLVLVRLTGASGGAAPAHGSGERSQWYPMRELLEHACRRAPWADETERARLAADEAREVARREAAAARERTLEQARQRRRARRRDRGRSW